MIRIDGTALRLHRLDLGLSQRSVARTSGVSFSTLSHLENNADSASYELTWTMLRGLVNTLGVPLGALLADDTPDGPNDDRAVAPEAGPDDMTALGGLLLHTRANTKTGDLAESLGWTLDRLRLAARALDHHLRPLGMQVHSLRGGYNLRPHDGYKTQARTRLDRLTFARSGTQALAADLIHAALTGTLDYKRVSGASRPHLSQLLRNDVLTDDRNHIRPGPALIDALNIPDDTADTCTGPREGQPTELPHPATTDP